MLSIAGHEDTARPLDSRRPRTALAPANLKVCLSGKILPEICCISAWPGYNPRCLKHGQGNGPFKPVAAVAVRTRPVLASLIVAELQR